ncbi:unnamed protein product [Lupinus luteus]|uniref:Uncharacterized protein n=1 Tax=Lupinus luteus TaxID=3873 RepID=A0AAV1YME7_LUPLU
MASSSSSRSRCRNFSTMEASSRSLPQRPYSPIPSPFMTGPISSPPHSPPSAPLLESQPRDPNAPPRNPYSEPDAPPQPKTTYYQRLADKRLKVEAKRKNNIIYGFDLRPSAVKILESDSVEPLEKYIQEFTELPARKKYAQKKIFKSLSSHYPASFSLKLANLLLLHPPLHIRNEVVLRLYKVLTQPHDYRRIGYAILVELKNPILESFKIEFEELLLVQLSEAIGNLDSRINEYRLGGWIELHEYIVLCVSLNSNDEDSVLKGLILLGKLLDNAGQMIEFWSIHYTFIYNNLKARMLDDTANENFHALTFDALLTMMRMAQNLRVVEIGRSIFSMLLDCIGRHSNEGIVLKRVCDLGNFAFMGAGEIIIGKENNIFHCMLGIAEKKDTSRQLRYAAIQVLKDIGEENDDIMLPVIKGLYMDDALRVLRVSMDMLLCIEDDPIWFELDEEESISAGLSKSFELGKFLINLLFCQCDRGIVVPIAFALLQTTHAASKDWREHHAEMVVIAALADRQKDEVAKRFEEVEKLVFDSLNGHHRVLWAAVNALRILSEHNLIPNVQYHIKFFSKLFSIVKCSSFPVVQVEAVLAIRTLAANCRLLDKMTSFWEEIFKLMLELLKNDKKKIQEEAVVTLKTVVVLIPAKFEKYYHTAVESLKAILFDDDRVPNKCLHANSLECMSNVLLRNEFVNFENEDAVKVMKSFKSLMKKLSKTDYLLRSLMLKALGQFCQFPGVNIDRYINKFMPMLLQYAQLDIDLKVNMNSSDSNWFENVRVEALNVLSQCAVRSPKVFSHHLPKVYKVFAKWLSCSSPETQMASVSALPKILLLVKSGERDKRVQRTLQNSIVQSLVEALHKETDDTVHRNMLNILSKCIESAKYLMMSMVETIKGQLLPYVDKLLSTVARLWVSILSDLPVFQTEHRCDYLVTLVHVYRKQFTIFSGNDFPDRMKEFAVSIFNIIIPHFPDKLQMYHNIYTSELLKARDGTNSQRENALGIGICAEFGGQNFKTIVDVAMARLYSLRLIEADEPKLSDIAVSSLWKICEFHRENINGPVILFGSQSLATDQTYAEITQFLDKLVEDDMPF